MPTSLWQALSPSDGGAAGSRARLIAKPQSDEFLEQFFVLHARMFRRVGEVLVAGNLWVGIGLQQIKAAALAEAIVETRIAAQVQ